MKNIIYCLFMIMLLACSCQSKVTIVSYNIHNGRSVDNKTSNLEKVSTIIKKTGADFVCLQEVDSMNKRNNIDEAAMIGKRVGMHYTYGAAIEFGGGKYGITILSKKKPLSVKKVSLPGREEKRVFLLTQYKNFYVGCTHMSLNKEDRIESAKIILSTIANLTKPVFIGGDFNDKPTSDLCHYLEKDLTCLSDMTQLTFPAHKPEIMIDYIWAKGFKGTVIHSGTINEPYASDHRPVYIKFEW